MKLLSVRDAADALGVSPALIYQWCQERRLPHFRLGGKGKRGKVAVAIEDLEAFLQSLRIEGAAAPAPQRKPAARDGDFTVLDGARLREAWKSR